MNAVAGPSTVNNEHPINDSVLPVWDRKIQSGDTVLIRLPNAEIRSIKLESDKYVNSSPAQSHASADILDKNN